MYIFNASRVDFFVIMKIIIMLAEYECILSIAYVLIHS